MTGPTAGRRNPPRRCRNTLNRKETRSEGIESSDSLIKSQDRVKDEQQHLQYHVSESSSDSDRGKYEAPDSGESGQEETNSSDFEEDEVRPMHPKRPAKPRHSSQTKRAKQRHSEGGILTNDADRVELSARQTEILNEIFSEFDPHKNKRITLSDILRVADDHGLDYGPDEVRDMVRFWDTSGTVTISRDMFMRLAIEAKFMVPSAI